MELAAIFNTRPIQQALATDYDCFRSIADFLYNPTSAPILPGSECCNSVPYRRLLYDLSDLFFLIEVEGDMAVDLMRS